MLLLYDIGTTGIKTCLTETDEEIKILGSATLGYKLYVDDETGVKGGAEQHVDEWWNAMCISTEKRFEKVPYVSKEQTRVVSFCSQMQDLCLLTKRATAFAIL